MTTERGGRAPERRPMTRTRSTADHGRAGGQVRAGRGADPVRRRAHPGRLPDPAAHATADRPLVYLDSANTSQKPRAVVEAIEDHYLNHNANVARAMHQLGAEATEAFEGARATVAPFIGAPRSEEVVFTKNASEALNLVRARAGRSACSRATRSSSR